MIPALAVNYQGKESLFQKRQEHTIVKILSVFRLNYQSLKQMITALLNVCNFHHLVNQNKPLVCCLLVYLLFSLV